MSRTYECPFCGFVTGHYPEAKSQLALGVHIGLRHRNVARVVLECELHRRHMALAQKALARVEWP